MFMVHCNYHWMLRIKTAHEKKENCNIQNAPRNPTTVTSPRNDKKEEHPWLDRNHRVPMHKRGETERIV